MNGRASMQTLIKKILMAGALLIGVFYLAGLLWLFSHRLVYPYELDWIEGGVLKSVTEILKGHNLYVEPTIAYVPLIYAPLYFYIAALSAKLFGASLFALRLVSAIASLASLTIIVLIVVGETNSWFWGFVSAGLFAGLYQASRFWFDLARVDSLFLMLFLFFLYALRRGDSLFWQISAGVFASLAALTKQAGLTMCLPIIAVYFLLDWRHRFVLPLITVLVYGSVSVAFILSSHGWYTYYCYSLLLSQQGNWMDYTFFDLVKGFILPNIPVAALLTILMFSFWSFQKSKERLLLWLVVFASTIITSYAAKAKVGGVNNDLIPTFAIFSLFLGVSIPEILSVLRILPKRYYEIGEICLCLLAFLQMTQVIYKPWLHVPSADDYKKGARALQFVKRFTGNVYVPNSSIALMAGKNTFAHPSAIWEVIHSHGESKGKEILETELQKTMDARLFEAVVVFSYIDYFPDLQKYYILDESKYILVDENWHEKADVYILP